LFRLQLRFFQPLLLIQILFQFQLLLLKLIPTPTNGCKIVIYVIVTEKKTVTKKEIVNITVTKNSHFTNPVVDDKNWAAKWDQCGGNDFNEPICCQSGSTCHKINDYYSQRYIYINIQIFILKKKNNNNKIKLNINKIKKLTLLLTIYI